MGVCSLIVVLSVMSGFDQNLKEKLLGFNFHINAIADSKKLDYEKVNSTRGVTDSVLFSRVHTAARNNEIIYPVVVKGIEFSAKEKKLWNKYLKKGAFNKLAIGKRLADQLGLKVGDELEIFNPQTFKPTAFQISGIFNFGIYDMDSRFVVSSFSYLEDFFKKNKAINYLGIRTDNIYSAEEIAERIIRKDLENLSFVRTWVDMNKSLFSALKLEKITMFIILSLIIFVASFNIFTTQTVNVVEKIKDIGILKSLGLSKIKIGFLFCIQGIILGIAGIIIGSGAGIGISVLLDKYRFIKLPPQIYYVDYLPVLIDYKDVSAICAIAFIMVVIFSLFPGLRAAKTDITRALRYE